MKKFKCLKGLAILLAMVIFLTVAVGAEDDQSNEVQVLTELERKLQTRITVDYQETDIDVVIKSITEKADIDVIKSPEVVGMVTAKLTDVPLSEALENILAAHDYGYVKSESMIRILPVDKIEQRTEKVVNRIYTLTYADVKGVEDALKKFISKDGSVSSNKGTSNIIVTDLESKVQAIDQFIDVIDRKTLQVLVEARIYDITCKDRLDFGVQWGAGSNTTYTDGSPVITTNTTPFLTGGFDGSIAKTTDTTGGLRFGWLNSSINIDVLIKAQKENIEAKLLASPRVLVLDNETAEFKIITKIPYQQLNQGSGSSVSFSTTEFEEVGVTLIVSPHITRDGMVRLALQPSFSVKTGEVNVGDPSAQIYPQPVIDERMANTTLLVKDGHTVVLGGLRKKDTSKQCFPSVELAQFEALS